MEKKNDFFVILLIFPSSGNKWKKKFNYNEKKKIWCRTWMGYCPQAGLGTGRAGVGRLGAGAHRRGRWCAGLGVGAPGAGREGVLGRGRCRQLGARAQGAAGVRGRARACAGMRGRERADVRALGVRGAGSERQDAR